MDLRQLQYFCAIVEAGSLSAAARSVLVAQPTLTVAMRNLEREIGTTLLMRTAHGVKPTEAGSYLHHEAHRILQDISNTTSHLRDLANGVAGQVHLSVAPAYSWAYLADVLGEVASAAPGIQVRLSDLNPLEVIGQLIEGASDLGIVVTHDLSLLKEHYGPHLEFEELCVLPVVAVLPLSFADAPDPISIESLRDEPWVIPVTPSQYPGVASLTEQVWRNQGWLPQVVRHVSTSQTSLPMIAGGLGVALMPASLGSLAEGSVILRELKEDIPELIAVAGWKRDRVITPATATLLRVLRETHKASAAP